MPSALVSWIGTADLEGGTAEPISGPLASILRFKDFKHAYLLHNQSTDIVSSYCDRLSKEFKTKFTVTHAELTSPIHFADIYKVLDATLGEIAKQHPRSQIDIQLTSGTPAMTSVSILTGKTKYQVGFLQSSLEQGVQQVEIPFDIAADFLPSVSDALDDHLAHLIAGEAPSTAAFDKIITKDRHMLHLKERAAILAAREVPVLIHGETGTGKELFARAIHNSSTRSEQPFISLNCGAIPADLIDSTLFGHTKGAFTGATANKQGVFAGANGGTLFLDEFGELPLDAQVRLLRVLQDGSYIPVGSSKEAFTDVRIIVATNKNLIEEISQGRFREDLFYRVAIGVINLPPLRQRKGDQWLLAEHLIDQINQEAATQPGYQDKKISAGAKKVILSYEWPGNIRELHATLLRASLWGAAEKITEADINEAMLKAPASEVRILDRDISQGIDINELLKKVCVHYIERALAEAGGSKTKAAELLSLKNYQTLNNWMEKYGIK
ncbi:MAG: sigma 54-interacting transcriptional regulator [Candidatus Thiodiazotropha taylori]|nr:sigma 54-interacting transcriptional regulator [Candidatus Thiodiazotropha taylori]